MNQENSVLTVLVVDDDLVTLELMRFFLEGIKFKVSVASCLEDARIILKSEPIQILISDLSLPDGNGKDLMQEVSSNLKMRIYGIAVTGYEPDPSLEKAGFLKQLTKPIDFDILEASLTTAREWLSTPGK